MATSKTAQAAAPAAQPGAGAPAVPDPGLPTHGGLYEFDPSTQVMRALEGGPPAQAQTPSATTGEQT